MECNAEEIRGYQLEFSDDNANENNFNSFFCNLNPLLSHVKNMNHLVHYCLLRSERLDCIELREISSQWRVQDKAIENNRWAPFSARSPSYC